MITAAMKTWIGRFLLVLICSFSLFFNVKLGLFTGLSGETQPTIHNNMQNFRQDRQS